jgi:trehalose 6-phosphate synthase
MPDGDGTGPFALGRRFVHPLGRDGRLIVVSNRGPITFELDPTAPGGLTGDRGPGGLVTALAELGRRLPVTWIATALTDGDRRAAKVIGSTTDRRGDERVPASSGARTALRDRIADVVADRLPGQDLRLRLVPLPPDMFEAFYRRVCNPFLWFVQHSMYAPPYGPNVDAELLDAWQTGYRPANERLADAAVEAMAGAEEPLVLLQDYHFYLAAARIRERRPDATILHFTHIPWPPAAVWQLLPQGMRRAICEGLLGADVVGLQTDRYATHFLDSVASFVRDARVEPDGRSIAWHGRTIRVRSYPISIDPDGVRRVAASDAVGDRMARLNERLERARTGAGAEAGELPQVIVRADRMEPSKNALRGFLAFEALLERRPELRDRVRFIAVQAPTRPGIAEYDRYATAVREVVARVNGLVEPDEQPIWLYDGSDYAMAIAALRLADVVLVNPIVDGMNLVAKEAALIGDRAPVLVLSETAGAAEQLAADSLTVAPADIIGTARQLERALAMPDDERRGRARRLRASVREQDIGWWIERQLRDLDAVRRGATPPSRRLRDQVRNVESPIG